MKNEKVLKLYKNMVDAYSDYSRSIQYPRRAPQAKVMSDYINHVFSEFGFKSTAEKVVKPGYWLHTGCPGTEVIVKKGKKEVLKFCNSNGYGTNPELAKFIIDLHKEYLPGFERELKIDSILED